MITFTSLVEPFLSSWATRPRRYRPRPGRSTEPRHPRVRTRGWRGSVVLYGTGAVPTSCPGGDGRAHQDGTVLPSGPNKSTEGLPERTSLRGGGRHDRFGRPCPTGSPAAARRVVSTTKLNGPGGPVGQLKRLGDPGPSRNTRPSQPAPPPGTHRPKTCHRKRKSPDKVGRKEKITPPRSSNGSPGCTMTTAQTLPPTWTSGRNVHPRGSRDGGVDRRRRPPRGGPRPSNPGVHPRG
jgi:hypothetical protein